MTEARVQDAEPQGSVSAAPAQGRRLPAWAGALALVLAVALGVGIGFVAFGGDTATSSTPDPEVEQVLDDFFTGFNAYDADAIRAVVTDDAVLGIRDAGATGAVSLDAALDRYQRSGVTFERVGDPIVRDGGAGVDVVQLARGGSENSMDDFILVLRMVREDGALKIEWERIYEYRSWRELLA